MGDTSRSGKKGPASGNRSWPLAVILTLRFALVAAIPVAAFTVFLVFQVIPSVRNDVHEHQQAMAGSVVRQVESYFSVADRELRTLAKLLDGQVRGYGEATALLDAYVSANDFYEAIYVADANGTVSAIGLPEAVRGTRRNHIGLDVSHRDFVVQARKQRTAVWSDSFLSPVSLRLAVAIAVPAGERMVIGEVAVAPLPALARKLTESTSMTVMMLDRKNQLTAHSNDSFANQQLNLGDLPVVMETRTGGQAKQLEFRMDGGPVVGSAWAIPGLDWLVVVSQPRKVAYGQIDATWIRLLGAIAAAVIAALAAAIWTSRVVSQRFATYSRNAQQIASGKYDLRWEASGIREFNQLRDSLDRMSHSIREREREMREAQRNLLQSEERLLATVEQTPNVAIQWYDSAGCVVMWNRASEKLYGISRESAVGRTLDQLIYIPQQATDFIAMLSDSARHGPVGPYESTFVRPDGGEGFLLCTTFAIPGEQGEPRFVCMDIDITDQKQAEHSLRELNATLEDRVEERTDELTRANEELVSTLETLQQTQDELLRSEKLAALGSMVAGIAHELNTPVGNGLMAVTTLDAHTRGFEQEFATGNLRRSSLERYLADSRTATDILLRNLQRAGELIRSFKQVAVDQTSAQRRSFRLGEVVDEILLAMQPTLRHRPCEVVCEIETEVWLDSFPGPLGQILTNLIQNSVTHGLEGRSAIQVRIIGRRMDADHCRLEVSDDGSGIAAEYLGRIFDPFFTTRLGRGGSGLGLNIVHSLATKVLGGRIRVDSTPGTGTRFILDIPCRGPQAAEEAARQDGSGG